MKRMAYFSNTGSIVFVEATLDLVDCWGDLGELGAVDLLGLGAHAGDGQDLSVLDAALLQLAEQDPKTCRLSAIAMLMGGQSRIPYLQHSRRSKSYLGSSA